MGCNIMKDTGRGPEKTASSFPALVQNAEGPLMTIEWLGFCLTSHLKGHLTQLATYYWSLIDI